MFSKSWLILRGHPRERSLEEKLLPSRWLVAVTLKMFFEVLTPPELFEGSAVCFQGLLESS
jgi:hypothetical protein